MNVFEYILLTTFLITIYGNLKKWKMLPFFPLFITTVVLFELLIEYYYAQYVGNNLVILNLYSRLCVYYYLFIYYQFFKFKKWAPKLKLVIVLYVILSFLAFLFIMPSENIDIITYNLGMFLVIPLVILYLYDSIHVMDNNNYLNDPYFYFSFGILIFYTASFPILGFINFLIVENPYFEVYTVLLNLGNIFLSLAYLGGVLCSKKPILSTGLSSHPL